MKIQDIPINERPRERLIKYGVNNLSNEELLAIIIKKGCSGVSAKDLGIEILKRFSNIADLKNMNIYSLSDIKGLGQVKKIEILAAIELGRRIYLEDRIEKHEVYNHPKRIYEANKYIFYGLKQEYFYVFYLDSKKNLIERKLLFMGTVDRSLIHPREVFKNAYLCSATGFICCHNHPSGDVMPSKADLEVTKTLMEIGRIQGIELMDHIIVSENHYFSFYENNLMK